jgi:tight adherence protein C
MTLLLVACFVTLTAAIVGTGYWLINRQEEAATPEPAAAPKVVLDAPAAAGEEASPFDFLRVLGGLLPQRGPKAKLERDLAAAGYRHPQRRLYFQGVQIVAGILGAALFAMLWRRLGYGGTEIALGMVMGAMIGGWSVGMFLRSAAQRRRDRIRAALPPALDLMVLGMEAGQPLDIVLSDTSRELRRAYPDLAHEFNLVPLELRAGNPRGSVLANLARRIGDTELTRLVNVMVDSDRYGTGMAPALKNHARYLRTRRRQSAQEQARKVGVKLVFPVFFLIFPSVLLVTLGPAVISLFTQLIPMLSK